MAFKKISYNEITANPLSGGPNQYIRDAFVQLGWVEDKVVIEDSWVKELYVHSNHPTDPVYLSFNAYEGTYGGNPITQESFMYVNLGFDDAESVSTQPTSLSLTPNPPVYSALRFGVMGTISFDVFGDENCVVFSVFDTGTVSYYVANYSHYSGTRQLNFMAGTLDKYADFSGGQYAFLATYIGAQSVTRTTVVYFDSKWHCNDPSKADAVQSEINVATNNTAINRTGSLRSGGVLLFPQVQFVNQSASASAEWYALGVIPNTYYNRYTLIYDGLLEQEGRTYFCKTYGNPAAYNYYIFDITE